MNVIKYLLGNGLDRSGTSKSSLTWDVCQGNGTVKTVPYVLIYIFRPSFNGIVNSKNS